MIERRARRLGALAATVLFGLAVCLGPVLAAGDPDPKTSPEPKGSGAKGGKSIQKSGQKKKKNQGSELQQFIDGYRAARALVLDGKYEEGIAAFKALGRDGRLAGPSGRHAGSRGRPPGSAASYLSFVILSTPVR